MTYTLHHGDCLDVMRGMDANSVDSVVTDPPYGLSFMGKDWDHGVPGVAFWREALRVAKPGAMLLAFGGTRTFHRLTCAIEDAGWEIRDVVTWLYGSGFPKSLDISKAIDKAAGEVRHVVGTKAVTSNFSKHDGSMMSIVNSNGHNTAHTVSLTAPATPDAATWAGWGTALKPAWEPVILAMKPLDGTFAQNALTWGVAGLAIDKGRIDYVSEADKGDPNRFKTAWSGNGSNPGWQREAHKDYKPVPVGSSGGRWPANLILDEDAARALDEASGERKLGGGHIKRRSVTNGYDGGWGDGVGDFPDDTGGASRFFKVIEGDRLAYFPKASRAERNAGLEGMEARGVGEYDGRNLGLNSKWAVDARHPDGGYPKADSSKSQNHHPTVKPLALMRYLCRLTSTPTGGVVLDPFMGSGTTGVAALLEGRSFVGIEREQEYITIARRRIEAAELPLMRMAAD